jgi:YHS domain-containing protein
MQRLIILILLCVLGYFLIKKIGKSLLGPSSPEESSPPADAELIQDPQCGTYFLRQRGIKGVVEGKVVHFCSEECYEKYLKRRRHEQTGSSGGGRI